jgi:hypothetical protein
MPYTKQFDKLKNALNEQYLGKIVKPGYKKDYGKIYNEEDIDTFARRVARSRGIKIDKQK